MAWVTNVATHLATVHNSKRHFLHINWKISIVLPIYASQEYLKRMGRPNNLSDLHAHDCLHMGRGRDGDYWSILEGNKVLKYRQRWVLIIPNTVGLMQAVAAGAGLAVIPDIFVSNQPSADKLIRLDEVIRFPKSDFFALYPSRKHLPYRVHLFLDFLKSWSSKRLALL